MAVERAKSRFGGVVRTVATGVVFLAIVVLLLLWLAGAFHPKIDAAGRAASGGAEGRTGRTIGGSELVTVQSIRVPRVETAVGTVQAVLESSIAAKLLAKVIEVNATAGQRVQAGEVMVRLDDADLRARLEQALAAEAGAVAARDQAQIEQDRVVALMEKQAAAPIESDRVRSTLKTVEAELQRTRQAVIEARTVLDYATIKAPMDGIVVDKRVEVGDTVTPGQVLLTMYDPTRMQLVASVRESLTRRLAVGGRVGVRVDALGKTCEGVVSEIVPEADSVSRSFQVKVTGPCPPGIYTGMFGRLLIEVDEERVLVVPRRCVRSVGQLSVVEVAEGETLRRRAVQIGRSFDENVEVLSGLREGERVALGVEEGGDGR